MLKKSMIVILGSWSLAGRVVIEQFGISRAVRRGVRSAVSENLELIEERIS